MNKRFSRNRLIPEEESSPMEGLINLADVMLVLSVGLLLALIINWNIDIGGTSDQAISVTQGQEVSENMPGLSNNGAENPLDYTQYQKMGTVYKDPTTGKLYMVTSGE